ncbi:MAG: hypothetical protein QOJ44_1279 [Acidimicrobiaceae bacterium]|jgi:hypothetical protein|nr:hypothetical protein [Acidimicrobiaceae bacterium]
MEVFEIKLEVGARFEVGGLSVFPLTSRHTGTVPLLTGPEALEAGLIVVDELDPPEVPSLAITNLADVPVLLVEGEMLIGGDQNRTMNVTVLCPAKSRTIVPVSCVEAGRWGDDDRRVVVSSRRHAPASLRAAKTANLRSVMGNGAERLSDQSRIWDEVDRQSMVHGVYSDTSALDDVQAELESWIADQLESIHIFPDQVGVVCAIGTEVVGVDIFDRPSALGSYLRAIVAGHALDAPAPSRDTHPLRPGGDLVHAIEHFLAGMNASARYTDSGVGLGQEIHLRGGLVGIGLTYNDALVHLAAFPTPA